MTCRLKEKKKAAKFVKDKEETKLARRIVKEVQNDEQEMEQELKEEKKHIILEDKMQVKCQHEITVISETWEIGCNFRIQRYVDKKKRYELGGEEKREDTKK